MEALSVADRILLLQGGVIEQVGTPPEIYESPRTRFAAEFMGSNNHVPGEIVQVDGDRALLRVGGANGRPGQDARQPGQHVWGQFCARKPPRTAATGLIRLERMRVGDQPGPNRLRLPLETDLHVGERWEYVFALGDSRLRAWGPHTLPRGEHWVELPAELPAEHLWVF